MNTLALAGVCAGLSWPYAVVLASLSLGGCGFLSFCVWIQYRK